MPFASAYGAEKGADKDAITPIDAVAFAQFLAQMQGEARAKGIDERYVGLLASLQANEKVRSLAARQPEYVKPIWGYLEHLITAQRITLGQAALAQHAAYIAALEKKYGVPRGIIVAIWGVETNYGSNKGSFSVLQALATLGFDGKRARFGRQQLLAALGILQDGDINPAAMKGSWAGAMGHTQFIPTTYQAYAADGTGDGKRDIWNSVHDALASTANYLKVSGWQRGLPWGVEVKLPPDFDYRLAGLSRREPAAFWRERGVVKHAYNHKGALPDAWGDMAVFMPGGARGPAFLVTRNFRALLRYNTAPAYALAVGRLSERFFGEAPLQKSWAITDRPLLPAEIKALQSALSQAGYEVGKIDGILGRTTRRAVRAYQIKQGLVADGYATPGFLAHITR